MAPGGSRNEQGERGEAPFEPTAGEFVFCGESTHAVDKKARVFLPKRFQQGLNLDSEGDRTAVLSRGLDGCLFLFPLGGLERALRRMNTEAFAPSEERRLQRAFFRHSQRVTLDSSGRLLIPEALRELSGIEPEGEVVMVGVMDRVELWSLERWAAYEERSGDAFLELEDLLTGGGARTGEDA